MGEFQNGRKGLKQDNQLQHFSLLWIGLKYYKQCWTLNMFGRENLSLLSTALYF